MSNNINKPILDGVIIPYPDGAEIIPLWSVAEPLTLGGRTRREVFNRKYKYVMNWKTLYSTYYSPLEVAVNKMIPVLFTYEKWTQSAAGVLVLPTLSSRSLRVGVGDAFWSEVTLECIEVNSRI
jgi:hypothetical protein